MLILRLPEEIENRLTVLAKKTGRTESFYASEAILEYLDDLEDAYLGKQVLDRINRGEEPIYTLDKTWDSFFLSRKQVSEDFMPERATQDQPERKPF